MTGALPPPGVGPRAPESNPLAALVARARSGDRVALEAVAVAVYPVVRAMLRRRLRGDGHLEADDLTHIAVTRAVARLGTCQAADDRGVRAWVRGVAWRVALEEMRTGAAVLARRTRALGDYDRGSDPTVGLTAEDPATWEAGVVGPLDELARAAVDALDRIPRHVGVLFWMRLIEAATWPATAHALGTTTAGAKRRFQRAIATLRRALLTRRTG